MKFLWLLSHILALALRIESQTQISRSIRHDQSLFSNDQQVSVVTPELPSSAENYPNTEQDSYLQASNFAKNENAKEYVELQPPRQEQINEYFRNKQNRNIALNFNDHVPVRNTQDVKNITISDAVISFGLRMLKNINQPSKNVVISPISVCATLALLQQGALGVSQKQISTALQMTPDVAANSFKSVMDEIQERSSRNILRIANNVYVADSFELSPAFKRTAMQNFGSEVTPIKFQRSEKAVSQINRWVSTKTNDKIPEILKPDAVSDYTQLVLVNAVYFKGLWQVKFKPESTIPQDFYLAQGGAKNVLFMRIRGSFRTAVDRTNNAEILILPFENNQYSLMIILPVHVFGLEEMISLMTGSQLAEYNKVPPKEVHLEIPKFTVRGDLDMNPILRNMGITNLFSQHSELNGVGVFRTFPPQVTSAVHSAMLSIDEDGGSAAAATAFVAVALSYDDPAFYFKANRPFLAVLWDNHLELPLFMAKIVNPSS